ncbi:SDR family NAD(P)-dependent oxidoreductase [Massilia horti]|uniref:SDR family NAD(P)-dependent oxidoreductase n=1 Tax=Massilia horti TaxID=2562153 RepID=A0A4Y9SQM5_9BURK|nr:SDR family NAD(P)-dependent oxidoreductase [Massilia horti]TFW28960.1 SDR family NAD(P)-dependent oxidoreductase [Massilia horti]
MKDFRGKVAVITGAAGGIGRELANRAAELEMKLVLADVQVHALERATSELLGQGAEVLSMVCDVSKARLVQELADSAIARFGEVHLVFNNAGVAAGGLVWENTEADWEWVLGVNLWGVIHGVRVFTKLMLDCARRHAGFEGHIVNTASMAGLVNAPAMGACNVPGHGVVSLSETLYHDLRLVQAPIGVSVLCSHIVPAAPARSHHQRQEDLRNDQMAEAGQLALQGLLDTASVRMPAAEVARIAFDAVRDGWFYIGVPAPALQSMAARIEAILHEEPPPDLYAASPQITDMLRSKL